jgi:hypothetical protein
MNSAIVHDYLTDAQKHFSGHQSQNYFVAGKMAGADFGQGEIHGLNIFNPNQLFSRWLSPATRDGNPPKHFLSVGHLCRFVFGQDFNLVAGLTNGTGKTLCSILELSLLKTS